MGLGTGLKKEKPPLTLKAPGSLKIDRPVEDSALPYQHLLVLLASVDSIPHSQHALIHAAATVIPHNTSLTQEDCRDGVNSKLPAVSLPRKR